MEIRCPSGWGSASVFTLELNSLSRAAYGRPVELFLDEIDELSRRATENEGAYVFAATALVGDVGIGPNHGIGFLRRAFQLMTDPRIISLEVDIFTEGIGPEFLIWGVAMDLATEDELAEWIQTVEVLHPSAPSGFFPPDCRHDLYSCR